MNDNKILGYIIGAPLPHEFMISSINRLSIGEYIKVDTGEGEILGIISESTVSSKRLSELTLYDTIKEANEKMTDDIRDKSYISKIDVLGFIDDLHKAQNNVPSIPPIPGTKVKRPDKSEIDGIFNPDGKNWVKIGKLLRNNNIDVRINLDKIVSRHLGILAMTGMGKSNLVSRIIQEISKLNGTVIVFDYHDEYRLFDIDNKETTPAKIDPQRLNLDEFAGLFGITDNNQRNQYKIITDAFEKAKNKEDFWNALEYEISIVADSEEKDDKYLKVPAKQVRRIVQMYRNRLGDILDPNFGDPMSYIKENKVNIINISEFSEEHANILVAFYLENLLNDRKQASIAGNKLDKDRPYKFSSPVFAILEEAHVFIPNNDKAKAKYWAKKIAREGRKFGLGLGVVSQRPRSIDPNILSQMGSFAIMKLIQRDDQAQIESAIESNSVGLISQLTSLNVGDAILLGQWCNLTSITHIEEVKEKKIGKDQSAVDMWDKTKRLNDKPSNKNPPYKRLIRDDMQEF